MPYERKLLDMEKLSMSSLQPQTHSCFTLASIVMPWGASFSTNSISAEQLVVIGRHIRLVEEVLSSGLSWPTQYSNKVVYDFRNPSRISNSPQTRMDARA